MRNIILIISSIVLFSCGAQKETAVVLKEKKEGRKIYGTVAQKYLKESFSEAEWKAAQKPPLSFNVDNEYFYIRIANDELTETELNGLVGKKIEIQGKLVGEGFVGEVSDGAPPVKKKTPKADKTVEKPVGYVLVYEILEVDK